MTDSFIIENKNKKLILFKNGKFLYVEGERITYSDLLFLETPTPGLLGVRGHNLVEKRLSVNENVVRQLIEWLTHINSQEKKNIVKKKKEKINDGNSENTKQIEKE